MIKYAFKLRERMTQAGMSIEKDRSPHYYLFRNDVKLGPHGSGGSKKECFDLARKILGQEIRAVADKAPGEVKA